MATTENIAGANSAANERKSAKESDVSLPRRRASHVGNTLTTAMSFRETPVRSRALSMRERQTSVYKSSPSLPITASPSKRYQITRGLSTRNVKEFDMDELDIVRKGQKKHESIKEENEEDHEFLFSSDIKLDIANDDECDNISKSDAMTSSTMKPIVNHYFDLTSIPLLDGKNRILESNLQQIKHLVNGSQSNICKAIYQKDRIIIKIIQAQPNSINIADKEFDNEHNILSRISHQHIVGYYGDGMITLESDSPRRFLAIERLNGGTLMSLLEQPVRLGKQPFTDRKVTEMGLAFARALAYLHEGGVHKDLTVIHRDLKPDNIGFTDSGMLKLMDFGLCVPVRRRTASEETYEMTGMTGSLRYMAPEVMISKPYTEKVDMYAFGLILWQMKTGLMPYSKVPKDVFRTTIVEREYRPQLIFPPEGIVVSEGMAGLMSSCWSSDPLKRPEASTVVTKLQHELDRLPVKTCWG